MKKNICYLNVLNILAAISVVWIHFGNEVHWYDGSIAWKMCVPIQVVTYWAVPVFFMLTGATLMDYPKKYDTKTFFYRRFSRGIFPYILWTTILLIVNWRESTEKIAGTAEKIVFLVNSYINSSMETTYWFFLPLIAIYLAMPVFSLLTKNENRKIFHYALVTGVITISILPFSYNCLQQVFFVGKGYSWNSLWNFPAFGGYAIYPVLGYWAATYDFSKQQRRLIYFLGIFGAVVRFFGISYLSVRDQVVPAVFMDYLAWPALTLALAVWVFIRYVPWDHLFQKEVVQNFLSALAKCSLGVYLMHVLVIERMASIAFFGKYTVQWYYVWPFFTYAFCALLVWIIKRIPIIKWIFP